MASSEHLETLRRRNKELLEKLKRASGELQSFKLTMTCKTAETKLQRRPSSVFTDDLLSVKTDPKSRLHQIERNEPFGSNTCGDSSLTASVENNGPDVAHRSLSEFRTNQMQTRKTSKPAETPHDDVQSIPLQNMYQKGIREVIIQSPNHDLEGILQSDRRRVQPLLGYDWIAGLLDAESSLTERSEQFFSELRAFRQVNKEECVHSQLSRLPGVADPVIPLEEEVPEQQHAPDSHQCTFCYRINSRLFATPLDPQAACPVCKMPKADHAHTGKEPAFIRVSIPRSTLLPAYQYKAHRRSSFDPSDSLGLPSHCLSGWLNATQKAGSQMSSLDLRSSLKIEPDLDRACSARQDLSVSRVSGGRRSDQLLDISRLARFHFQHLDTWRDKHE